VRRAREKEPKTLRNRVDPSAANRFPRPVAQALRNTEEACPANQLVGQPSRREAVIGNALH
jgi:hypothetical protein